MNADDARKISDAPTIGTPSGPTFSGATSAGKPAPTTAILEIGQVIAGRFQILEMLGLGGMGAVYKAYDRDIDRIIALKCIRPELYNNQEIVQRFTQELLLARQIAHKNVIRIFDVRDSAGLKFITMEYLEGRDLGSLMDERGKLPASEAVAIIRQVCSGLAEAHAEGVVHRDLKPSNIMLEKNGRVVVMDFGLARAEENKLTQTGAIMGTFQYMSPEQAKGEKADARSDIFTVGIIFYELLTGKTPYPSDSSIASLLKRTQEAAVPPSTIDPGIPRALNAIVCKCLERDVTRRYQSIDEVLGDLEATEQGRTASQLPSRRAGQAQRNRFWLLGAAVLIALALSAGGFFAWKTSAGRTAAQPATVSVLVADFTNHTGDPIFDDTLEPMFNVALEGAPFINAYSRGDARKVAAKLPNPTNKLDEQSARLVGVRQGIGTVITGSLSRRGDGYKLSVEALDAQTGNTIASAEANAANKDGVLLAVPELVAPIRKALGDTTPESVQLEAARGTFTAASLEVVHQYGVAMEQQFAGKMEEAFQSFSRAAELDPNFARAYAGMAGTSGNLNRSQDAERYFKLALAHVDRMTERERYRTRAVYYRKIGNLQKCVEENSELVRQYPADNLGHLNLANCYSDLRNMPKALEEGRRAVEISPKAAMQRRNLALIAAYAGDLQTAEREAQAALQLNPSYEKAYLPLAYSQLLQGQLPQAADTYRRLEKVSRLGASFAASGLADIAFYEGRFADAVRILEEGAASDQAGTNLLAAEKIIALAYVQLSRGQKKPAVEAAERAKDSKKANIRFLAARVFAAAGETAKARALAATLASDSQPEPQADAKLIEGEVALQAGDPHQAIKTMTEANQLLDTWTGRFDLGRAYLEAGEFAEADAEFDRCIKRRGEALELYDGPSYGFFPPVYYYQGRVREGLKSPGAVESYRLYLSVRGKAGEDPLLREIRRRAGQ
jgi:tetratricopeptide (TPR) repeat protein/tRNA A-37 threonylcarbamoyl transferase component Bud32